MTARLKLALMAAYAAFTSSRNTVIAQLVLVVLLGVVTLVGMSDVANHENNTTIAGSVR